MYMGLVDLSYGPFGHPYGPFDPPPLGAGPRKSSLTESGRSRYYDPLRSERRPNSMARTAAWVRSETPSLEIMRRTCFFMVLVLIKRFRAICWLLSPRVRSPRIST